MSLVAGKTCCGTVNTAVKRSVAAQTVAVKVKLWLLFVATMF